MVATTVHRGIIRGGFVRIGPPQPPVEWTTKKNVPVDKYVCFVRREEKKDGRVAITVEKA